MAMDGLAGVSAMAWRAAEVRRVDAERVPTDAVMVVVPAVTAVASPPVVMVATPLFDELQAAEVVMS
jgi:hypothetical protein